MNDDAALTHDEGKRIQAMVNASADTSHLHSETKVRTGEMCRRCAQVKGALRCSAVQAGARRCIEVNASECT